MPTRYYASSHSLVGIFVAFYCLAACGTKSATGASVGTGDALGDAGQSDAAAAVDGAGAGDAGQVSELSDIAADSSAAAIQITDLCPLLAKKTCAALTACACPMADGSPAACTASQTDQCAKSILTSAGAILLGSVVLDSAAAAVCLAGFDALAKSCDKPSSRNRPAACQAIFLDTAAIGGTCATYSGGLLCAGGLGYCDSASKKCQSLPGDGKTCGDGQRCAVPLVCDGGICQSAGAGGAPCQFDASCQIGLVCDSKNSCQQPAKTGESCNFSDQCATGLACQGSVCGAAALVGSPCMGEVCGANAVCFLASYESICRAKFSLGAGCSGWDSCQSGLFCDYTNGSVCLPLPKAGQPCPELICGPGLACPNTGKPDESVCVPLPKAGAPCLAAATLPCEVGLGCDANSGTCALPGAVGGPCLLGGTQCPAGAVCDLSSLLQKCIALGDVGAVCGFNDGACKSGLYCDYSSKVVSACKALVAPGGTCNASDACVIGYTCASSGMCEAVPNKIGESCQAECGGGLQCIPPDGICSKGLCGMQ